MPSRSNSTKAWRVRLTLSRSTRRRSPLETKAQRWASERLSNSCTRLCGLALRVPVSVERVSRSALKLTKWMGTWLQTWEMG